MPDAYIVDYCSPTLAGLKTGSMFTAKADPKTIRSEILKINRRITQYGLRLVPLRFRNGNVLLYLYRPKRLQDDLSTSAAEEILKGKGYPAGDCEQCVADIAKRMREDAEFPHEIGLFLGYPPEDVRAFMEHPYTGFKCVGSWKVYSNEEQAKRTFQKFDNCTKAFRRAAKHGIRLEQLITAEQ